jgi:hypothetical protein
MYGLKLTPNYVNVVGHHVDHARPNNLRELVLPSKQMYQHRCAQCSAGHASWLSPGAPWPYKDIS